MFVLLFFCCCVFACCFCLLGLGGRAERAAVHPAGPQGRLGQEKYRGGTNITALCIACTLQVAIIAVIVCFVYCLFLCVVLCIVLRIVCFCIVLLDKTAVKTAITTNSK